MGVGQVGRSVGGTHGTGPGPHSHCTTAVFPTVAHPGTHCGTNLSFWLKPVLLAKNRHFG